MVIALVLIWGTFWFLTPNFVSARNLSNLAVELSITAVLALGMLLIIVSGNIDLSIGSGVGLFGGLAAVLLFDHGWPAPAAMAVAVVIAVLVWVGMGALIVTQNIPAFIITLAGLLVFKGLHWKVIHNATIPVTLGSADNLLFDSHHLVSAASSGAGCWPARSSPRWSSGGFGPGRGARRSGWRVEPGGVAFSSLFIQGQLLLLFVLVCNQYQGIPLSAVILGITAFAIWALSQLTRFGRYLYAIGGNEEAAFVSGIPVKKVVIGAFGIMGFIVALGGFMQTAYAGASTTTTGQLLELDAIAACVIGGTSLKGGRGTVSGVLFGSLIMASLLNGMTLMAVAPEMKFIARGLVLALAVWMDVRLNKGK